jgi:hypothetical protein
MKRILATFAMLAFPLIGCAQLPPTSHSAQLSWTAPSATATWIGCTAALPCTYAIGRAAQSGGSCPSVTGTNYVVINGPSYTSGLTYSDPTPGAWCYIAQTLQGSAVSSPSNTATATVPGNPTAPSLGNPAIASALPMPQPAKPAYQIALNQLAPMNLRVVK